MGCILPYKKNIHINQNMKRREKYGKNQRSSIKSNKKYNKKYNQKSKFINIKYTPNAISEYERIYRYCKDNNISLQGYIKELIKTDLDNKGIPCGNNIEE